MPDDALAPDLQWYKDAVIYELRVKTFHDSDGDGIGDFRRGPGSVLESRHWAYPPS